MNEYTRRIFGMALIALIVALAPPMTRAEVTRVEISNRQDVLGGKAFGTAGAYEKLSGKAYFSVDPNNPHNKIIADIDKAPRNSLGKLLVHLGRVNFGEEVALVRVASNVPVPLPQVATRSRINRRLDVGLE